MKVLVQPTMMFMDSQTKLVHGVNFIDEELSPKLAATLQRKLDEGYKGLELYEGDAIGYDPKGSRIKRKSLEDETAARKIEAKAKAKAKVNSKKVKEDEGGDED